MITLFSPINGSCCWSRASNKQLSTLKVGFLEQKDICRLFTRPYLLTQMKKKRQSSNARIFSTLVLHSQTISLQTYHLEITSTHLKGFGTATVKFLKQVPGFYGKWWLVLTLYGPLLHFTIWDKCLAREKLGEVWQNIEILIIVPSWNVRCSAK